MKTHTPLLPISLDSPTLARECSIKPLSTMPFGLTKLEIIANGPPLNLSKTASLSLRLERQHPPPIKSSKCKKNLTIGKYKYIVEKENRIGFILVENREALEKLIEIPQEVAKQVLSVRTIPPEGTDPDTVVVLENFTNDDIKGFIQYLSTMENPPSPTLFPPPLNSVLRLGPEGLEATLEIQKQMNTAPEDASTEVKTCYDVTVDHLANYVNGDLQDRVEHIEESLHLLYSQ